MEEDHVTSTASTPASRHGRKLTDPLVQDQQDRELETKLSEAMLKLSKSFRDRMCAQIARADEQSTIILSAQNTRAVVLDDILVYESGATQVSIEKEFTYASEFKVKAADNLLKVLAKVYSEVLIELLRQVTHLLLTHSPTYSPTHSPTHTHSLTLTHSLTQLGYEEILPRAAHPDVHAPQ
jgi:hypothetical protein